jgi:hydroxymethylpyrimidine/phosphomethylpyrimidine kinase
MPETLAVTQRRIPIVLTIAGSDSGGGAGVQADLRTFQTFGVYGTSVVTAITAQNTVGVRAVHVVPAEIVKEQVEAIVSDLRPRALKSGMLASAAIVDAVADSLVEHRLRDYVLDPVIHSSSGTRLLDPDGERLLVERLLPLATIVTPNLAEAERLSGIRVTDISSMREAARRIVGLGAQAVVVTGGHLPGDEVRDVFWDGTEERAWGTERIRTRGTHGTGCTLSAAGAAGLANDWPLPLAVERAIRHVQKAIAGAPDLGRGNGPLDPFPVDPRR